MISLLSIKLKQRFFSDFFFSTSFGCQLAYRTSCSPMKSNPITEVSCHEKKIRSLDSKENLLGEAERTLLRAKCALTGNQGDNLQI